MVGGPIGLVRDGDEIVIDAESRELNLIVGEEVLEQRRQEFISNPPKPRVTRGTLGKYARLVKDASQGCITDADD